MLNNTQLMENSIDVQLERKSLDLDGGVFGASKTNHEATFRIGHTDTNENGVPSKRHLARMDWSIRDATTGRIDKYSVYLVASHPAVGDTSKCLDMFTDLTTALSLPASGIIQLTRILNGES